MQAHIDNERFLTFNQWLGRSGVDVLLCRVWPKHLIIAIATALRTRDNEVEKMPDTMSGCIINVTLSHQ